MKHSLLLFFSLIYSTLSFAQEGTIRGQVKDSKTGEAVIGATVLIDGTVNAASVDVEGNYELKVAPGTYTVVMSNVGYKPLSFPGTVVAADQVVTVDGKMVDNSTTLSGVTVTGQKQTGTEVALIQDIKNSEVVVSGISSDQIVKSLDRDAAEVVKRIPGVTVQNNNFIVIRGLAERYNTVLLNDALTPSSEVDTRSFSFDILPSSVIDRILISKSGSPELPGEFGGGVVKVYTKNSVLENSTTLSVSGWNRSTTTFKDYMVSNHSGTDWLGFDSGQRKLPDSAPAMIDQPTDGQLRQISSDLHNEWTPRRLTALPDLRASLGLSRRYDIGAASLSNVTSVSYSNTREQYSIERNRYGFYNPATEQASVQYKYNDERALSSVRLGVIHNWQLRLNDRSSLEFRNFLNQYGTDEVVHRTGLNFEQGGPGDGLDYNQYSLHYQSRTIYSGQLQGTHEVGPDRNTTLTWAAGYNYVARDEPDYRRYRAQRAEGSTGPFLVQVPFSGNQFDASRYYSKLHENTYMARGQWERRFAGRDTTSLNQYKLRVGFYAEQKQRDFSARFFSYVPTTEGSGFNRDLLNLPIDQIFAPQNVNNESGFTLSEGTNPEDRYSAKNTLVAGYVSVVAPISEQFTISGGLRTEYNRKYLRSGNDNVAPYEEKRTFLLPSFNASYNFTQQSLLRLGGSVSVNRPEFREVANYTYYDFANNYYIKGSDSLRTATIYNGDLRYEFYPSRSEMISVGVFYKYFVDPIEQVTQAVTGSDLYITYQNAQHAYDIGAEVEVRKSLAGLSSNSFLQNLSLVLNASLVRSRVSLTQDANNLLLTNRALQGQSPYVVNAGLFYQDQQGWQVSAQYNVIGPRIAFVGDTKSNYSVFELPQNTIDVALTKAVGEHLQLKAGVKNLLNQLTRQYYDLNRNGKIDNGETAPFARYRKGAYSMLGVVYKF